MITKQDIGVCFAGFERGAPMVDNEKANHVIAQELCANGDNITKRKEKMAVVNFEKATSIIDDSLKIFNGALNNLVKSEENISEQTKKVSGSLRDSCQKMADGLQRIQKTADFNSLERQVALLERAAAALSTLSDLQDRGKLEQILKAIK